MACYARWTQTLAGGLQRQQACGQCIGCRLEISRQWAIRCVHEAQLYPHNIFVTLTYDDEHLPRDHSLQPRDTQLFFKRLRRRLGDQRIRYYLAGEYGDRDGRPHYHAIIFNCRLPDEKPFKETNTRNTLRTSEILNQAWGQGFTSIGEVTFQSAAYVTRYVMKKLTGLAQANRVWTDPETGEVHQLAPEFARMSRGKGGRGIGHDWLSRFESDVYPHGMCVVNGIEVRPPKYYDKVYKAKRPSHHRRMMIEREKESRKHIKENTNGRLYDKETVKHAQLNQLKRKL